MLVKLAKSRENLKEKYIRGQKDFTLQQFDRLLDFYKEQEYLNKLLV